MDDGDLDEALTLVTFLLKDLGRRVDGLEEKVQALERKTLPLSRIGGPSRELAKSLRLNESPYGGRQT